MPGYHSYVYPRHLEEMLDNKRRVHRSARSNRSKSSSSSDLYDSVGSCTANTEPLGRRNGLGTRYGCAWRVSCAEALKLKVPAERSCSEGHCFPTPYTTHKPLYLC